MNLKFIFFSFVIFWPILPFYYFSIHEQIHSTNSNGGKSTSDSIMVFSISIKHFELFDKYWMKFPISKWNIVIDVVKIQAKITQNYTQYLFTASRYIYLSYSLTTNGIFKERKCIKTELKNLSFNGIESSLCHFMHFARGNENLKFLVPQQSLLFPKWRWAFLHSE